MASSEQVLVATAASALIGYVAHRVNQEMTISAEFEGPKVGALQERLDFIKALSRQEDVYDADFLKTTFTIHFNEHFTQTTHQLVFELAAPYDMWGKCFGE
jgi:hypothetical protein